MARPVAAINTTTSHRTAATSDPRPTANSPATAAEPAIGTRGTTTTAAAARTPRSHIKIRTTTTKNGPALSLTRRRQRLARANSAGTRVPRRPQSNEITTLPVPVATDRVRGAV
uniref:(northern house mosquito) hypothetical protein n=1 Tax=Culex pipiens TaxID=7175 RepID=A0A8D8JF31_CULPI